MSKHYESADHAVLELVAARRKEFYQPLDEHGVTIACIFVTSTGAPALTHAGREALALIKKTSQADRAQGVKDAQLFIDKENWETLDDAKRAGLIDHELHHLIVEMDEATGTCKRDPQNRPVLSMRKHDVEIGWFLEVALRHGKNSPEQDQARRLFDKHSEAFWPFLELKQGELAL